MTHAHATLTKEAMKLLITRNLALQALSSGLPMRLSARQLDGLRGILAPSLAGAESMSAAQLTEHGMEVWPHVFEFPYGAMDSDVFKQAAKELAQQMGLTFLDNPAQHDCYDPANSFVLHTVSGNVMDRPDDNPNPPSAAYLEMMAINAWKGVVAVLSAMAGSEKVPYLPLKTSIREPLTNPVLDIHLNIEELVDHSHASQALEMFDRVLQQGLSQFHGFTVEKLDTMLSTRTSSSANRIVVCENTSANTRHLRYFLPLQNAGGSSISAHFMEHLGRSRLLQANTACCAALLLEGFDKAGPEMCMAAQTFALKRGLVDFVRLSNSVALALITENEKPTPSTSTRSRVSKHDHFSYHLIG